MTEIKSLAADPTAHHSWGCGHQPYGFKPCKDLDSAIRNTEFQWFNIPCEKGQATHDGRVLGIIPNMYSFQSIHL